MHNVTSVFLLSTFLVLLAAGRPAWAQPVTKEPGAKPRSSSKPAAPASQPIPAAPAVEAPGIRVELIEEDEEGGGSPAGQQDQQPLKAPAKAGQPGSTGGGVPQKQEPAQGEVVVTSATRTPQTIEEAPSIISVITREDILSLGYRSLTEVLRHTVGFDINDNGHWPDTGVRGINDRTTYGDKIQMLIDGHNMSWRQFNRNYHNPSWVGMEDIARIEVIRGPGSAIWGANALNGVINIVTRDLSALDGAEVTFGADHRFASQLVSARAGTTLGELAVGATVSYYQDQADALLAPVREFQLQPGKLVQVVGDQESGVTIGLQAAYKWFKLFFHKSLHDTGAPLSTFSILGGDDSRFVTDRYIVRLAFEKMLLDELELSAEFDYDDYRFSDGTVYEANPADGNTRYLRKMAATDRRWEWRVRANYIPSLKVQAMAGLELEYLDLVRWHFPEVWLTDSLEEPTFNNLHFGGFLQAQYTPIRMLALTGGIRLDYDQIYGLVPTPRAGLVLRLPAGFYFKGLFGMAYKAPSFHDLYYFRKNAYYGNPNLDPEQSITGEGLIGFRIPGKLDIRVTGFFTRIDNLIGYQKVEPDTQGQLPSLAGEADFPISQRPSKAYNQKLNKEYVNTAGVEAEVMVTPHQRVTITLHGTYRYPWDPNRKPDPAKPGEDYQRLEYTSLWTAGGSLRLRLHRHLRAAFRGVVVGPKEVPGRGFSQPGWGCPINAKGAAECWTSSTDPTLETPISFVGTLIFQAPGIIHEGLDLYLKLDNFTDSQWYDAGRDLLYPQRRFQGMLWLTVKL